MDDPGGRRTVENWNFDYRQSRTRPGSETMPLLSAYLPGSTR